MTPEDYFELTATDLGTDLDGLQSILNTYEGRMELTKYDPLMFSLIFMDHHLRDEHGRITLSEFHIAVAEEGKKWMKRHLSPMELRTAFIAPRGVGKSTWNFTILPMWAAAHGHIKFLAAFSDSAAQAEGHLQTFKNELEQNDRLRNDFPDLCTPEKAVHGRARSYSNDRIWMKSGFVFDANGIDTNSLGKKAGTQRPDLIILDDIEKGEKNYSEYQAGQQLRTVFDDIAPMNLNARMVFVGTTTMPNSIMDQFRKHSEGDRSPELKWIEDQNVKVHYFPAIMSNEDGEERSIWPDKWSLEFLQSRRHTRDFAKNYMNKPMNLDGQFWGDGDIEVIDPDTVFFGKTIISVDPNVTKNKTSDYTGLVVLSAGETEAGRKGVFIRHAEQFKGTPEELAAKVAQIVEDYDVGLVLVETNQGGDLWYSVFKEIECRYLTIHQKVSKEIRAGKALDFYQKNRVFHTARFPILEEQMFSFPKIKHDDVLDAMTTGVLHFLDNKSRPPRARQLNYIGGR